MTDQPAVKFYDKQWFHYMMIAMVAAVLLFFRLDAAALSGHECHIGLTARTMLDDSAWIDPDAIEGDVPAKTALNRWMLPVENGQPRLKKTPLMNWCSAAIASMTGVNEFSTRAPAAIAGLITALVTLALGRRLLSPRAAFFGAMLLVCSFGFVKFGRKGLPEMLVCMWMTIAMAAFYLGLTADKLRRHIGWMLLFWVAMGLANLTKQAFPMLLLWPAAAFAMWRGNYKTAGDGAAVRSMIWFFAVSAIGLVAYLILTQVMSVKSTGVKYAGMFATFILPLAILAIRRGGFVSLLKLAPTAIPGMIIMLALFVPWIWYVSQIFGQAGFGVIWHQTVERGAGTGTWNVSPAWNYLKFICSLTAPWCPLLLLGVVTLWMQRFADRRQGLAYLNFWFVGMLVLLAAMAGKREHYILPALPAMALLMGHVLNDMLFERSWLPEAITRATGLISAIAGPVAVIAMYIIWQKKDHDPKWMHLMIVSAAICIPLAAAGVLAMRRRYAAGMCCLIGAMFVFTIGFLSGHEYWDEFKPMRDFGRLAGATIPRDEKAMSWQQEKEVIAFYLGRDASCTQMLSAIDEDDEGMAAATGRTRTWNPQSTPWLINFVAGQDEKIRSMGYAPVLGPLHDKFASPQRDYILYHRTGDSPTNQPAGKTTSRTSPK